MNHSHILWGNENYDFYYLPILKNAQTWGKIFFEKNFNFVHLQDKNIPTIVNGKNVVVFYREPMSRWFTGAAQWFAGKKVVPGYVIDDVLMELLFLKGQLDDHTKPQKLAFDKLSYEECIFFDLGDENFLINLVHYLENIQKLRVQYIDIPKVNTIEENPRKLSIKNQLVNAYNNNQKFRQYLHTYLQYEIQDHEMLKTNNMFYKAEND